jgi:hypothetical protein
MTNMARPCSSSSAAAYPSKPRLVVMEDAVDVAGHRLAERREAHIHYGADGKQRLVVARIIRSIDRRTLVTVIRRFSGQPDDIQHEPTGDMSADDIASFHSDWSFYWIPKEFKREGASPIMLDLAQIEPYPSHQGSRASMHHGAHEDTQQRTLGHRHDTHELGHHVESLKNSLIRKEDGSIDLREAVARMETSGHPQGGASADHVTHHQTFRGVAQGTRSHETRRSTARATGRGGQHRDVTVANRDHPHFERDSFDDHDRTALESDALQSHGHAEAGVHGGSRRPYSPSQVREREWHSRAHEGTHSTQHDTGHLDRPGGKTHDGNHTIDTRARTNESHRKEVGSHTYQNTEQAHHKETHHHGADNYDLPVKNAHGGETDRHHAADYSSHTHHDLDNIFDDQHGEHREIHHPPVHSRDLRDISNSFDVGGLLTTMSVLKERMGRIEDEWRTTSQSRNSERSSHFNASAKPSENPETFNQQGHHHPHYADARETQSHTKAQSHVHEAKGTHGSHKDTLPKALTEKPLHRENTVTPPARSRSTLGKAAQRPRTSGGRALSSRSPKTFKTRQSDKARIAKEDPSSVVHSKASQDTLRVGTLSSGAPLKSRDDVANGSTANETVTDSSHFEEGGKEISPKHDGDIDVKGTIHAHTHDGANPSNGKVHSSSGKSATHHRTEKEGDHLTARKGTHPTERKGTHPREKASRGTKTLGHSKKTRTAPSGRGRSTPVPTSEKGQRDSTERESSHWHHHSIHESDITVGREIPYVNAELIKLEENVRGLDETEKIFLHGLQSLKRDDHKIKEHIEHLRHCLLIVVERKRRHEAEHQAKLDELLERLEGEMDHNKTMENKLKAVVSDLLLEEKSFQDSVRETLIDLRKHKEEDSKTLPTENVFLKSAIVKESPLTTESSHWKGSHHHDHGHLSEKEKEIAMLREELSLRHRLADLSEATHHNRRHHEHDHHDSSSSHHSHHEHGGHHAHREIPPRHTREATRHHTHHDTYHSLDRHRSHKGHIGKRAPTAAPSVLHVAPYQSRRYGSRGRRTPAARGMYSPYDGTSSGTAKGYASEDESSGAPYIRYRGPPRNTPKPIGIEVKTRAKSAKSTNSNAQGVPKSRFYDAGVGRQGRSSRKASALPFPLTNRARRRKHLNMDKSTITAGRQPDLSDLTALRIRFVNASDDDTSSSGSSKG